jgi:hypothetical protein
MRGKTVDDTSSMFCQMGTSSAAGVVGKRCMGGHHQVQ